MALGQKMLEAVLYREKDTNRVDAQGALPILHRELGNGLATTGYAGVGINAVNTTIGGNACVDIALNLRLFGDVGTMSQRTAAGLHNLRSGGVCPIRQVNA